MTKYQSFKEFYPYYLSEHQNTACRRLHIVGTGLVITLIVTAIVLLKPLVLALLPIFGYGFAWVGHFFFEKNRPATFTHPFYSLLADFVMFKDVLTGKIKW